MSKFRARSAASFLRGKDIARLVQQAEALAQLSRAIRKLLPDPLKEHCQVLGLDQGQLHLAVDSPVWSARLRYYSPRLLQQLAARGTVKVRTIETSVLPPRRSRPEPGRPRPRLSVQNGRLLSQTAQGIADQELRAALLKIASRAGKSEGK